MWNDAPSAAARLLVAIVIMSRKSWNQRCKARVEGVYSLKGFELSAPIDPAGADIWFLIILSVRGDNWELYLLYNGERVLATDLLGPPTREQSVRPGRARPLIPMSGVMGQMGFWRPVLDRAVERYTRRT